LNRTACRATTKRWSFISVWIFRDSPIGLRYRDAFYIHAHPLPARYLPGGIWHSVGRFAMLHRMGANHRRLFTFFLIENSVAVGVGIGLGSASLLWFDTSDRLGPLPLIGLLGAIAGLFAVPLLINRGLIPGTRSIPLPHYLATVGTVLLFWLIAASAFVCFTQALGGALSTGPVLRTGGIYLVSWGIGYLSVFTPQGVGVFELVAGHLLGAELPLRDTIVLVAGFRLVVLTADILAWLASHGFRRHRDA